MKFNFFRKKKDKSIVNNEGAKAWKLSPEMELYTAVVTASLSKQFYENMDNRLDRIIHLIKMVKPEFVAKLAIYTREKMHLRSIPLVLLVELSKVHNGDSLVKNAVARVVQRADEITELLAYYQIANKRTNVKQLNKLSKQLQKGLGLAFNKFDEYQFAKYNRNTDVRLKDALFLVHPKAKDEGQQALFNKIANDALTIPYTWEVELSKVGQLNYDSDQQKEAAFTQKWEELIDSGRLAYMAMMRNLRNILQAKVSAEHIQKVAEVLSDANQVRRSKQLPFRYLSAYRELEQLDFLHASYLMDALEKAVLVSAKNIKGFELETRILLAADVSGSMYSTVSKRSKIRCYDIGLLLSMLMRNRSKSIITGIFGSTWKAINLPKSGILANTWKLSKMEGAVGYSTNGHLVINDLIKRQKQLDKIFFFTDLQLWDSKNSGGSLQKAWATYKREVAPKAKLYLFDLQGYGQAPLKMNQKDVYLLAGWSDKVFDVLAAIEAGSGALKEIKQIAIQW